MAIRNRVVWGNQSPFSDPRLKNVGPMVKQILERRWNGGQVGGSTFNNSPPVLPRKPTGYYREYDLGRPPAGEDRGKLRLVIGDRCEVYVTGDHYDNFRQVIQIPGSAPPLCPLCRKGLIGLVTGRCDAKGCPFKLKN